jgi:acyl carrier protein
MPNGSEGSGEAVWANDDWLVRELIRKLVGEIAPLGSPEVQPEHTMREELGFDSIREVEITFVLEELFGFEPFVIEDSPALETVGDLQDFTLDMIAQGRAKVPTRNEIDRLESLISRSARPS